MGHSYKDQAKPTVSTSCRTAEPEALWVSAGLHPEKTEKIKNGITTRLRNLINME